MKTSGGPANATTVEREMRWTCPSEETASPESPVRPTRVGWVFSHDHTSEFSLVNSILAFRSECGRRNCPKNASISINSR